MLNYFAGHLGRLNYAPRLRRGQSIGSGLVGGSVKPLLNKRVKQTGARWRVEHVGPLVELGALAAGPEWQAFWKRTGPTAKIERGTRASFFPCNACGD